MSKMGSALIEAINEAFKTDIPQTKEKAEEISDLVDGVITEHNYGYCDNCDGRRYA